MLFRSGPPPLITCLCIHTLIDTNSTLPIHLSKPTRLSSPAPASFRQRFFASADIPYHTGSAFPTNTTIPEDDRFIGHHNWVRAPANEERSNLRTSTESLDPLSDLLPAPPAARANDSTHYEELEQYWLHFVVDVASEPDCTPHRVPMRAAKMAIENIPYDTLTPKLRRVGAMANG